MLDIYKKNNNGRDFICSDIHGEFALLQQELDKTQFDESVDRLFCLGDLIDRGSNSIEALDWLAKPWLYSIQGNHERMLINAFEQESQALWQHWMMGGGTWAEHMTRTELEPFYQAFKKLPVSIELQLENDQNVALVHSELPIECDWSDVRRKLQQLSEDEVDTVPFSHDMLWKKSQSYLVKFIPCIVKPVKNIHHVFHGHTIVKNYLTITNRTFMDLGSFKTHKIGFINPTEFVETLGR